MRHKGGHMIKFRNPYFILGITILFSLLCFNLYILTYHYRMKAMYDEQTLPTVNGFILAGNPNEPAYLIDPSNGAYHKIDSVLTFKTHGSNHVFEIDLKRNPILIQKSGSLQWRFLQWGLFRGTGDAGTDQGKAARVRFSLADPPSYVISLPLLVISVALLIIGRNVSRK
jgi:hypothetical protein